LNTSGSTSNRRQRIWEKLKFAFRVRSSKPLEAEDLEMIDRVAATIHKRGMGTPAILALQSVRPLNFLGSQAMVALQPFAELFLSKDDYERFAAIIERRDGFAKFIERFEELESEEANGKRS